MPRLFYCMGEKLFRTTKAITPTIQVFINSCLHKILKIRKLKFSIIEKYRTNDNDNIDGLMATYLGQNSDNVNFLFVHDPYNYDTSPDNHQSQRYLGGT